MPSNADAIKCSVVFIAIGFAVSLGAIYDNVKKYFLLQKIKNTPTSKARSVAIGLTEVFGKAKRKNELLSPISKKRCVYWALSIQYYDYYDRKTEWKDFFKTNSTEPFYLKDSTGQILIDPKDGIEGILPTKTYRGYISGRDVAGLPQPKPPAKVMEYIDSQNMRKRFDKCDEIETKFGEYCVEEDTELYALGSADILPNAKSAISSENLIIKKGRDNVMRINTTREWEVTKKLENDIKYGILISLVVSGICLFLIIAIPAGYW
ncbi:MAG: hypothetical protein V1492_05285 [Candidatus Micrarchaeota archaeon]